MILDEAFHASAGAVDFLVKKLGRSIADVRNDKTRVGLSLRDLRLVDDDARTAPATGLIVEAGKQPHRLFGLLGQGSRLLHQRCAECFELLVIRLSQNEIYVLSPGHHRTGLLPQQPRQDGLRSLSRLGPDHLQRPCGGPPPRPSLAIDSNAAACAGPARAVSKSSIYESRCNRNDGMPSGTGTYSRPHL